MRIPFLITLLACLTGAAAGQSEWRSLPGVGFEVSYQAGNQADAEQLARILSDCAAELAREFRAHDAERLLRASHCNLVIHPTPNDKAGEATATLRSSYDGHVCLSEMHVLAPSAHGPTARTVVDEPKNEVYFRKLIMHEYGTTLLGSISRNKVAGWRFDSSPSWFVQGYEEYLGLFLTTEHSRTVTYGKYLAEIKRDPGRVSLDFGVDVRDAYVDGAVVLKFMHDVWGRERVQAILTSPQGAFGGAIRESLGVGLQEFAARWQEWLAKQ